MNAYEALENHDLLLKVFGRWPSFHDAEVHRVVMDCSPGPLSLDSQPSLQLLIHTWSGTGRVMADGYLERVNHSLVDFLFEEVDDLVLEGLSHHNVLFSLDFEYELDSGTTQAGLRVRLAYCVGLCGEFTAVRGKVLAVHPCTERGERLAAIR